jgi:transposase
MADQQHLGARNPPPLKAQQKISGRLTSDDVTQNRLEIPGYIDTARKHGPGTPEVLKQLMPGHPRMPPAQPIPP